MKTKNFQSYNVTFNNKLWLALITILLSFFLLTPKAKAATAIEYGGLLHICAEPTAFNLYDNKNDQIVGTMTVSNGKILGYTSDVLFIELAPSSDTTKFNSINLGVDDINDNKIVRYFYNPSNPLKKGALFMVSPGDPLMFGQLSNIIAGIPELELLFNTFRGVIGSDVKIEITGQLKEDMVNKPIIYGTKLTTDKNGSTLSYHMKSCVLPGDGGSDSEPSEGNDGATLPQPGTGDTVAQPSEGNDGTVAQPIAGTGIMIH